MLIVGLLQEYANHVYMKTNKFCWQKGKRGKPTPIRHKLCHTRENYFPSVTYLWIIYMLGDTRIFLRTPKIQPRWMGKVRNNCHATGDEFVTISSST